MRWDIFCRVIDNFGDIGVAWRLAADLALRGERVRLWVDDASALAWMAGADAANVEVVPWGDPAPDLEPQDVVVEAFGCDPPARFVERMAARAALGSPSSAPTPVWINLEYLSAEPYVERSHGLASPRASDPGCGLMKWFFYPGFTAATGGLLREPDLLAQQRDVDRAAWLKAHGLALRDGERLVSLFCYPNPALPALLRRLGQEPVLLAVAAGSTARLVAEAVAGLTREGHGIGLLRIHGLPWLTQADYDRLLWTADLNFVRGEDSFVRAQWAAQPFIWQIYPQHDGVHQRKLEAFVRIMLREADAGVASLVRAWMQAWNAEHSTPSPDELPLWERSAQWAAHLRVWRQSLLESQDLTSALIDFVGQKR